MFEKRDRVESMFIAIYFIEQIALVLLYYIYPESIGILISMFPVIFLTTIAFEKVYLKVNFRDRLAEKLEQNPYEKTRYINFKDLKSKWRTAQNATTNR